MTNQPSTSQIYNTIIIIIITIIAALGLQPFLLNGDLDAFVAALILVAMYSLLIILNHRYVPQWRGLTRTPLVIAWVLFGLSTTAIISIIGLVMVYLWQRGTTATEDHTPQWQTLLPIAANGGTSILGLHLAYIILGGDFPVIDVAGVYASVTILLGSILASSVISLSLSTIMQSIKLDKVIRQANQYILPEAMVVIAGLVLPVLYVEINLTVFTMTLGLLALLSARQAQTMNTMTHLKTRISEMTTISSVSHKISSHLSLAGTLESIYNELSHFLDATTVYIALYDGDQDTLDYQLVMVDGHPVERDPEQLNTGLAEYVVRIKQPIHQTHAEVRRIFKNLYDVNRLDDQQYMLAPLLVGTKIIGVLGAQHATKPDAFSEHDFDLFKTIATQASLALRNAILYDRTVRLADNLSIINQSLQDVMFNLDRQDAMQTACEIAANITRTSRAAVFMVDTADPMQMTCVETIGFDDGFIETLPYEPDHFHSGARAITDVTTVDDPALTEQMEVSPFKACAQIPLRSADTIIGVLIVYHDNVHYYEVPELNLLEMLANQVTAALDNADLLQALELYATEQAQLVHLSRISSETLELEQVIQRICQMLTQMVSVSRVAIGLTQMDKNIIRFQSNDGTSFDVIRIDLPLTDLPEIQALLAPETSDSLQNYRITDDGLSDGLREYMQSQGDKTLSLIPIQVNNKRIGVLALGQVTDRTFDKTDQRLLELSNYQISLQIENARIHTETEQQLANRLEQINLIEEISQQISEAMELEIIIQNVLEAALQSTQADFASIALIEDDQASTFDMIWREVVDDHLVPNRLLLKVEKGVVGHVRQTGNMVIIPDNKAFEAYVSPVEHDNEYQSSIALPMRTGNTIVGVLNLESKQADFFTGEQASFLNSLAGHAAISIDNANLLIERERQITTLTLLRELSLDALSLIEDEAIYHALVRTALILLHGDHSALYQVDPMDERITKRISIRNDNGQLVSSHTDVPTTVLRQTIEAGSVQLIPDVAASALFSGQNLSDLPYQSVILMPLKRRQRVSDLLCIGYDTKRSFTHQDTNIVNLLMIQVAGHLENTDLNKAITTSNDRMRAILDSTRDGIILLDSAGRIQDANSAATYLTGIDLNPYLYRPLASLAEHHMASDANTETWHEIVSTYRENPESLHNCEFAFEREDDVVFVKTMVTGVMDDTEATVGRLLIFRDITEERNLQEFQTMMQSMVLHDLRGPLTSIVTSMYVAENILALYDGSDFDDLQESLLKTFNVSLISAEDMLRQVDTLRDLPMLSQMQVEPQTLPLYDVVEGAFNSLSANYAESNIIASFDIPQTLDVFVDESLIRRVVINLMHNAFKYTPVDGEVKVCVVEGQDEPDYVRVQIADTGPGIPEQERERIFGQYVQIKDHKPRAGGKGTGLGLNFCKLAVEAHGGRIWVEADGPLSGACFSFTIPLTEWRANKRRTD